MIKYIFLVTVLSIILFACSNNVKQTASYDDAPEMTQYKKDQRNKAIALQCIRAYAANDSNFILAHNANNVVNTYEGRPPIHGIDSLRIVFREAFNTFKEYKPSNEFAVADSNYVFVFLYVDISFRKRPETWNAKFVEIFKFNDQGKIVMHFGVGEELGPNSIKQSL